VALRAFPVIYACDVEAVAAFYVRLVIPPRSDRRRRRCREPAEHLTPVADPEGNLVVLAGGAAT
jgi:hypothetical protein